MDATPKPPLPWEHKATIGCLALLTLMEIHVGILYFVGRPRIGFSERSESFALLLILFLGLALGLLRHSRLAWWMAVAGVGAIALFMVGAVGPLISETLSFSARARSESSYAWYQSTRRLDYDECFVAGLHCALLMSVPALLVFGNVRAEMKNKE